MERVLSQNPLIKPIRKAATDELTSIVLREVGTKLQRFRVTSMLGERVQRVGEKLQNK